MLIITKAIPKHIAIVKTAKKKSEMQTKCQKECVK